MTALLRSPVAAHRSDVMMSDPANPGYRIHRSARRPCSGGSPCWWSGGTTRWRWGEDQIPICLLSCFPPAGQATGRTRCSSPSKRPGRTRPPLLQRGRRQRADPLVSNCDKLLTDAFQLLHDDG
jgi:hypothetical protein